VGDFVSPAAQQTVRGPGWQLSYRGVGITAKIEKMVEGITYTSHAGGLSGDLEVELEDRDLRWQGPWFPTQGDVVSLSIGYVGEGLVDCGEFQVDEIELNGPPDVVKMKCLAAYITPTLRTPNTANYENQTLLQIAQTIAAKNGFTLLGAAETINVSFKTQMQNNETDLEFLQRVAGDNGYEFQVKPPNLIFYSRTALEAQTAAFAIARTDVERFSFKTRSKAIYKAAQVTYHDPDTKKLISGAASFTGPAAGHGASGSWAPSDTLKIITRCENGMDAKAKAEAALHAHNMLQVTGNLSLPGSTKLAGGAVISIAGFAVFDGNYLITEARHKLERSSGYSTEIEVRSV
jgi:uncharacterized protein